MEKPIDFSSVPPGPYKPVGWISLLGNSKARISAFVAIALGVGAILLGSVELQMVAGVLAVVVVLFLIMLVVKANAAAQSQAMQEFATRNGWEFDPERKVERTSLPADAAEMFTANVVTRRFGMAGEVTGKKFILFEVNGFWASTVQKEYRDCTILEVDNSAPVILQSNALTREDLQAMFRTAGLV